jgi:uncharacterized membrane protein YqjE
MSDANRGGLFASLRQLTATALEMVQVRLELLGTELEFEKRRLFDGLLIAAAAMVFFGVGLLLLSGFILLLFWDGYRLIALASLAVLFIGLGTVFLIQSRKQLKSPLGMFYASATELQNDRAHIQPSDRRE